mgnify:CR=1 FL=1
MEKYHEHTLPFLDVLIDNKQDSVITFTGLFTNFFSFTSSYKVGLITTLNRAFNNRIVRAQVFMKK